MNYSSLTNEISYIDNHFDELNPKIKIFELAESLVKENIELLNFSLFYTSPKV